MNLTDFLQLREELSLMAVMIVLLILDIAGGDREKRWFQPLAIGLFALHIALNCLPREAFEAFGGMYRYTPIMTFVKTILNVGVLVVFLQVNHWLGKSDTRIKQGEYYFLTLATLLGMYFMISSGNFLLFFIGLETASIPMTTLIAFDKYRHQSAEAGVKYILLAAFSSAIMIFGISLLYGANGTLYFSDIANTMSVSVLNIMAFVFFAVGLFFKLSLVPFHLWTADVYQGAPTGVTAYLSVISKGSAAFALFVILTKVFGNIIVQWQAILWVIIVLTITVGNLFALRQNNIKRFLAFSSISQAGYLVLTLMSGSAVGMTALVFYVLVYIFSNLAIFGVASVIENRTDKLNISDYNGLYQTNPFLSVVMMLALFSLAGIPFFAGFFSKFFVFMSVFEKGFIWLIGIALVNTVISLYYYLKVVKAMFLTPNAQPIERLQSDVYAKVGIVICFIGVLFTGLLSIIFDGMVKIAY